MIKESFDKIKSDHNNLEAKEKESFKLSVEEKEKHDKTFKALIDQVETMKTKIDGIVTQFESLRPQNNGFSG